ncbi:glycoside hydrolase [Anoxybacter fermentans]|uniref:Glycoside hydrolase n=1 Tax=Anoxybacter fermentans TaxID=1323375 RepID=A0A3Q9HPM1_9FIRM|nr:glycosyl hydrolase family 65 protein [Anoxybacter fermentans]AZR72845.1 glycoside hydrolase [Anoxybacter fermentans]
MRKYHQNKESIYPYHEWKIVEDEFRPEYNHRNETIFALGNGYIGLRGTFEEGYSGDPKTTTPGTYINGVYESEPIYYGEFIPKMPEVGQTMVNLADWKIIRLKVEDEWFDMLKGQLEEYQRVLDLKRGVLQRTLVWTSPKGRKIAVDIQRCISLTDQHRAVIKFSVTPLNFSGQLIFSSEVNGDVQNYHHLREKALKVVKTEVNEDQGLLIQETNNTKIAIAFAIDHCFKSSAKDFSFECENITRENEIAIKYIWYGKEGQSYQLEKYISFYTDLDVSREELETVVKREVSEAKKEGFEILLNKQYQFLKDYWNEVDVKIEGDLALQQGVRFNAFHLLQSCGRDGRTSIGAKGLTGEHYEGHYFWDTEIYVNPFFLYSQPEFVKKLLLYRYNILDKARAKAKLMGHRGALYAWRTINGHEASALFEGSTTQYHINAAIVYAIHKYVEATDDIDFLLNYGAEIIFETSRCWADRGGFIPLKGNKFCINEVCGPDEYKPGVNNNCYTNYMARFNLQLGVKVARMMEEEYPDKFKALAEKIGLKSEEIEYWQRCADEMYLPFNEDLGIHPQDDSFLYKEELDVDSLSEEDIPLVRNWHPLNIWRYQICKQADVVLLMFLLGDLFDLKTKKANYDYYEPRTTHDSSLSACIYSIIASEIGYRKDAYDYFMQTARLDLDDYNNNTHEGIHAACMAGSWMCVINGFAGMRVYDGKLYFNPYLPEGWTGYQFSIRFRGRKLNVYVKKDQVNYTLVEGNDLEFYHCKKKVKLKTGEIKQMKVKG